MLNAKNLINLQYIIGDLRGAGWSVRTVRENDSISDNDLYHVFKKVDIDNNQEITTTVGEGRGCVCHTTHEKMFQELRLACRYLCKQFQIDIKTVNNYLEYFQGINSSFRNSSFGNTC